MIRRLLPFILVMLAVQTSFAHRTGVSFRGGHWVSTRSIGFTNTMGTGGQSAYSAASSGSIMLSSTYYTMFDSIAVNTANYTSGVGEWYEDSLKAADTTVYAVENTALFLDGFVDQDIQINVFFVGSLADTFIIVAEQALSYFPAASDTGLDHWASSEAFNSGFSATDTLFRNDYGDVAPPDSFLVPAKTDSADADRFFTDTFRLIAPVFRIKIMRVASGANTAPSRQNRDAVHFELYCRHRNDVMTGASGRLLQTLENPKTDPRGRQGLNRRRPR